MMMEIGQFIRLILPFAFLFVGIISAIQSSSKIAESNKNGATDEDFVEEERDKSSLIKNPNCRLPKDRGNLCNNGRLANKGNSTASSIKWYFDIDTLECLAFGFNGCHGNANKFDSIFQCHQECQLPADYGGCSGRKSSAKNSQGQTIFCGTTGQGSPEHEEKCPDGFRCQYMAFFGICCDTKIEQLYNRNYRPKCANGNPPHQLHDSLNNWPVMYLGKSCQDDFCPTNMDCIGQEIFAHCCPK